MLPCDIPDGSLFYGGTHQREIIQLDATLRAEVSASLEQMHKYAQVGHTPKARPTKGCNACSLQDICVPKLVRTSDVASYIRSRLEDDG